MAQRDRSWIAAITAALLVTLLVMLYVAAVWSPTGQLLDHEVMRGVSGLVGVENPTPGRLGEIQSPAFAVVAVISAVMVARRGSLHLALDAVATAVFGIVGAVMLKAALPRPDLGVGSLLNSFPSATVSVFAVAAVVCGLAAKPGALTSLALGVTFGLGAIVSLAVVVLQWHRPSDVIGAWLLAAAGAAVSRAVSGPIQPRNARWSDAPERARQREWQDQLTPSGR